MQITIQGRLAYNFLKPQKAKAHNENNMTKNQKKRDHEKNQIWFTHKITEYYNH